MTLIAPALVDPLMLMRLHVEAEFVHDAAGALVRINEPNGAAAPRFFLGATARGVVTRFRHDVPAEARVPLEQMASGLSRLDESTSPEPFERILSMAAPVQHTSAGPAFTFPDRLPEQLRAVSIDASNASLLAEHLPAWAPDVHVCQPMIAVVVDGRAVSVCGTVRRTGAACEAGVETAGSYRGQGLAPIAVAAWASAVRSAALVPLYSTSWTNHASRAVARKLGLIHFGNDLHIT